jgi:hypothetical protein
MVAAAVTRGAAGTSTTPQLRQALGTVGIAMKATRGSETTTRRPDSRWLPLEVNHALQLASAEQWSEAHTNHYVLAVHQAGQNDRTLHSTTEPLVAAGGSCGRHADARQRWCAGAAAAPPGGVR